MDDIPIDRETLLSCVTPAELFGDALGERRALKRAYARLAKRFRPDEDAEAFEHLRQLYEAAQQGADAPVASLPSPQREPRPDTAQHAPPRPAPSPDEALRQAMRDGAWSTVLDLLSTHLDRLLTHAPELVGEAAERVVVQIGPQLPESALDVLGLVASHPALTLAPSRILELEDDVMALRALREASTDPQVPDSIVQAIRAGWYRPSSTFARAILDHVAPVPTETLAAAFQHMADRHPEALASWNRLSLRLTRARVAYLEDPTPEPPSIPEAERVALRRSVPAGTPSMVTAGVGVGSASDDVVRSALARVGPIRIAVGLLLFARFGLELSVVSCLFVSAGGTLPLYLLSRLLLRWSSPSGVGMRGRLVDAARRHGLFPHEVVLHALPEEPLLDKWPGATVWPHDHPLLAFEDDPVALVQMLGPRHLERLEARERPRTSDREA